MGEVPPITTGSAVIRAKHERVRFGSFEVDLRAGELRKGGVKIKLHGQPLDVLAMLLDEPGEMVTREELQQKLWAADTFVDFEHGLNKAINKLREALGDDADNPRFVETLPRRGYRFIVPVTGSIPSADQPAEAAPSAAPQTKVRPTYYRLVILGAVIVTVGALVLWKTVIRAPGVPTVLHFTALTDDGQAKSGPMATDGSRIYFNEVLPGPRNLIVQVSIKGGEVVPLSVPLKQPGLLDLSREGTDLLIASDVDNGPSSLWVQPVAGGSPRRVGTVLVGDARFGPDGTGIIYSNGLDVYSVSRDGSSPRKLLTTDSSPFSFGFSPDARVLRFNQVDMRIFSMSLMEAAVDGSGLHRMCQACCCGKWTSDGRFYIFQTRRDGRRDLWALPEAKSFPWRKREDKPIQLTAGPLSFHDPLPSKGSREIFAIGESDRAEVIRYDSRSGQFVPYLSGISAEGLAFSRDGQWVTYASYPDGTLWRSKVDGSERRQLTFPPLRVLLPRWSPDGQQIAFNATLPGVAWNVYLVSSEGGTPQRILPSEQSQMDANWSPDGNSLVFGTLREYRAVSNASPIYTIDLRSKRVSTLPGSSGLFSPRWSPDGRYVAAITSNRPFKLMLFDSATQKWTEAFGFEMGFPCWSRDGKYIYFFQDSYKQDVRERIVRFRLSDRKIENIGDLKNVGRRTTGTITAWFGLAPDDSPLLARDISTQEIYALEMDWP
jgi:Tol biopolymer transport system component/DNA-binding winged helix-turn-helix (wHTH) protein